MTVSLGLGRGGGEMLNQAFSADCLMRLVQREDVARFQMWRPGEDRNVVMTKISDEINSPNFLFPRFQEKKMKGNTVYSAPNATILLALRKLNRNIQAIYNVRQANRDDIVYQVKSLLKEGCFFNVLRHDIHSFYESIERNRVLNKINRDSIVSYTSRAILKKLFESPQFIDETGIPRGLGISATLAELYMRDIDRKIRSFKHVYFYGRYVDDIIIFTQVPPEEAETDLKNTFNEINLKLNPNKKTIIKCCNCGPPADLTQIVEPLEFLGYNFKCNKYLQNKKEWREVFVSIAPSKINKIKSRVAYAFINYAAAPDFPLLFKRIRFLTGNYTLSSGKNCKLHGGIYYNYRHIDDFDNLDDLDIFLHRLIFCQKGSIGTRLKSTLNMSQKRKLAKLSFKAGFEKRISHSLSRKVMANIRKCWIYEKN